MLAGPSLLMSLLLVLLPASQLAAADTPNLTGVIKSQGGQPLGIPCGGDYLGSSCQEAFRHTPTGVAATEDHDV